LNTSAPNFGGLQAWSVF